MAVTQYRCAATGAWVDLGTTSEITAVQVVPVKTPEDALLTLLTGTESPLETAVGIFVTAGDLLDTDDIAFVGSSSNLYARAVVHTGVVAVRT